MTGWNINNGDAQCKPFLLLFQSPTSFFSLSQPFFFPLFLQSLPTENSEKLDKMETRKENSNGQWKGSKLMVCHVSSPFNSASVFAI